jgi:hypothetical protein
VRKYNYTWQDSNLRSMTHDILSVAPLTAREHVWDTIELE